MKRESKILLIGLNPTDRKFFEDLTLSQRLPIAIAEPDKLDHSAIEGAALIIFDAEAIDNDNVLSIADIFGSIPKLCLANADAGIAKIVRLSSLIPIALVFRPFDPTQVTAQIEYFIKQVNLEQAIQNSFHNRTDAQNAESLAYAISHDLMAPIRAINGYTKMLTEEIGPGADADIVKILGRLQANSSKLGQMISGILSLSKIDRTPLHSELLDMAQMAGNSVRKLLPNDKYAVEIGPLNPVKADRALIQQVWNNLISNAIKFSANISGPKIVIASSPLDNAVRYSVKDNGVGFSMSQSPKLFRAFQRLHSQTDFEGLGMGLAVAAKIVEKHGGSIWIESETDKGTTIFFELPA